MYVISFSFRIKMIVTLDVDFGTFLIRESNSYALGSSVFCHVLQVLKKCRYIVLSLFSIGLVMEDGLLRESKLFLCRQQMA